MSPASSFAAQAIGYVLLVCGLSGLILLWRLGLSRKARQSPARLTAWDPTVIDFFIFLWFVICGGALAPGLAGYWIKRHVTDPDFQMILGTLAFQCGLLAGVLIFRFTYGRRSQPAPTTSRSSVLLSGLATYLITLPVVLACMLLWRVLMDLLHISMPQQEAVDVLRNLKDSLPRGLLLLCAIILAPIVEELVFRAGLFRYLRTRAPRWVALLVPAALFAAAHQNLASFPALVALGVIFALAYERTGRIGTSMVAHALFNLTTTALVLAGLDVG